MAVRLARSAPSPLWLSDSHIVESQISPAFDRLEPFVAATHYHRAGFSIVAGPPAQATHDPGCERQRALRVRVLLFFGLALTSRRHGFKDGLVRRVERIGEALSGRAIACLD